MHGSTLIFNSLVLNADTRLCLLGVFGQSSSGGVFISYSHRRLPPTASLSGCFIRYYLLRHSFYQRQYLNSKMKYCQPLNGHQCYIRIHHNIVADASRQNEEMEDLMGSEVGVSFIKTLGNKGVDNASYSV